MPSFATTKPETVVPHNSRARRIGREKHVSKKNVFCKKGSGLSVDHWLLICRFLFPEDLLNLR